MQKAHDIAVAGDTIYIKRGKYLFSEKGTRDEYGDAGFNTNSLHTDIITLFYV